LKKFNIEPFLIGFGLALVGLDTPCLRFLDVRVGELGTGVLVFGLDKGASVESVRRFFMGASSGAAVDRFPYVRSGLFRVRSGWFILLHS